MFCLPAKYPFKTEEIDTKGRVRAHAKSKGEVRGSLSKLVAIKSLVNKITSIKRKLITRMRVAALVRMRIDLFLFSDTTFDIDMGIAKVEMVRSKE